MEGAEFLTAHHARLLQSVLSRTDAITAEIDELSQIIEELLAPYEEQLTAAQAQSQPGWGRRAAQDIIAETGTDMTRFPPAAIWPPAAAAPRWTSSPAPARASGGTSAAPSTSPPSSARPLSPPARLIPREGARHRRISRKRGKAKAAVATGNTQMKVFHALLSRPGTRYQDLGPDYHERQQDHSRHVSRLAGELGNLGYDVTLCRKPQPEDTPAA